MSRHINIPIFIPHEGCPNTCVFCNQCDITGENQKADRDISVEIDTALSTYEGSCEDAEIAFFGGSFTGIDRKTMIKLLECAYRYIVSGKVASIRLSTRPDYIDKEILSILRSYGVTDIELGLQSMKDEVLSASKRGHTALAAEHACALIKESGFKLAGQMMIGLPHSSVQDEIYTAEKICEMGCDAARIYPTVVFKNTELYRMACRGEYTPLSLDESVERSADALEVFIKNGVTLLRIGLQSGESLSSADKVYAGANHSSVGELVYGEYYYRQILRLLGKERNTKVNNIKIFCAEGEQSKVAGLNKKNKLRLLKVYPEAVIRIAQSNRLSKHQIEIEIQ